MSFSVPECNSLSIVDLPIPIMVDILIQLPVESIVFCKCTCKFLHEIVSDPQFAKFYYARPLRSKVYPISRPIGSLLVCKTLYLVHPKLYLFKNSSNKFKIPLPNFETVLNLVEQKQGQGCLLNLHSCYAFMIHTANSCNGFLCLSRNDALVVTNPVTGEFVDLPIPPMPEDRKLDVRYALGFSPSTNNYKVLRLFDRTTEKWSVNDPLASFAQIQILGSRSWKNIGLGPSFECLSYDTYFGGTLNWIYNYYPRQKLVANFDFISEQFGLFSLPPFADAAVASLGVLGECLCVLNILTYGIIEIWVMREYGVEVSWTKVYDVYAPGKQDNWRYNLSITQLDNGVILIFHYRYGSSCGLIYYEPEKQKLRYSVGGINGGEIAIIFTPNFNLLKDVLVGDEVQVLNVKSRFAELKLCRDTHTPFLVQENSD